MLEGKVFVERILPATVWRDLGEDETAVCHRRLAETGRPRRPTLT